MSNKSMVLPSPSLKIWPCLIFFVCLISVAASAVALTNAPPSYTPLTDLGTGTYQGFTGGLYPEGKNEPPAAYLQIGLAQAHKVQPLNSSGTPDASGKTVLLSIGMSNTTMEFSSFKQLASKDPQKNHQLVIVDGAVGGQDAAITRRADSNYWREVDKRLAAASVSAAQVQVVWLKQALAGEKRPFPADAQELQKALQDTIDILQQLFPNLRLIYLSSRTYGGYATTKLNPEPFAYEGGFAVKWLIEANIDRTINAALGKTEGAELPWLAWGPYLWTNGRAGRNSDGLTWELADVAADGTHPAQSGARKVANLLLHFFQTDATTRTWYLSPDN